MWRKRCSGIELDRTDSVPTTGNKNRAAAKIEEAQLVRCREICDRPMVCQACDREINIPQHTHKIYAHLQFSSKLLPRRSLFVVLSVTNYCLVISLSNIITIMDFTTQQLRYIGSHVSLEELKRYPCRPSDKIEIRLEGFGFQLLMFERIPGKISEPNRGRVKAWLLVYLFADKETRILETKGCLFTRHRPQIFFLYENIRTPNIPVKEYELTTLCGQPTLLLICANAETDPNRRLRN
jgi:hypothetical protein